MIISVLLFRVNNKGNVSREQIFEYLKRKHGDCEILVDVSDVEDESNVYDCGVIDVRTDSVLFCEHGIEDFALFIGKKDPEMKIVVRFYRNLFKLCPN